MKKCILYCVICVVVVGILLGWTMVSFGPQLLGLYAPNNTAVIEAGMVRMRTCTTVYFLCGLMEVGSGILRGLGYSTTSTINSLIGSVAFRILWILIVVPRFHTLTVLYLSYAITWILTSCIQYLFVYIYMRREMRTLKTIAIDT